MSVSKHSEAEVLQEELNFLTDLLKGHKSFEPNYQRSQFHGVPYGNPHVYNGKKSVKSTNLNSSSIYKSKYHTNRTNFKNHFGDRTGTTFTSRSFVQKPPPVSVFPKQNTSYGAKQVAHWKYNKVPNYTQNLSSAAFKIVRTAGNAKVANKDSETCVANRAKVVPSGSISAVGTNRSKVNSSITEVGSILNPTSECVSRKKDNPQPPEKNVVSKHPKGAKVSYVPCSDCIIEILEFENGELHISQKKLDPSLQDDEDESAFIGDPPSPIKMPKSSRSELVSEKTSPKGLSDCADSQHTSGCDSVYPKPLAKSGPSTAFTDSSKGTAVSDSVEMDIKLSNTSSLSQNVSSMSKFTKSQRPCARNAKYSKVNVSTSKSQNSVAKDILKNKYSVKKSSPVKYNLNSKCKINKELKGCAPHPLKYVRALKSTSLKCLVNYSAKRTALLPVRNISKRINYASYSNLNSVRPSHTRSKVTKSIFPTPSYAKILKKAKALQMKSVYKVVNKPNQVANKTLKGSNGDQSSDKKWFKSNESATSVPCGNLNASTQPNKSNTLTKSETQKVPLPQKTPSCEPKNVLNASKIVTQHSLQRVIQKKGFTKKPSLNPLPKSFYSHTPIKKAKKVRVRKTTYKVVNRYTDHVSQVVQMIKTKYRTVNKRSASNSHLKWLQEQKRAYLARKRAKSLHSHAKTGWTYRHSSVDQCTRKHPMLKASRKHSLQNKVLKNICGVTYKVSKMQIKKSFTPKRIKKSHFTLRNRKNSVIVNVRGSKFQMSPGGKSLKRLGTNKDGNKTSLKKIKIGGFTYVQQKEGSGCLIKSSSTTQNVASRMLHRSINTVRAAEAKKTLRKNNMFCMFFNRFGRCNKEGNCPYIHDPSKIAVCTRFLRGTCKISGCPFSHEISPGKMAICSFFLQGNCTNCNCPYQHTSIQPGTRLCKAFVKGYCNKGSECQDAHILACPQLICEGFCEKESSCTWPHPPVKNNIKKRNDPPEVCKEIQEKDAAVDDISDQRYFTYEPGLVSVKCIKHTESVKERIQSNEKVAKVRNKKIAFAKQPEFIPLLVSDEEL